ncbi:hypothetical protein [Brevundimonas sp. NIBR11]|uniref:hypothetical protein n=1 Tax=Brevundimonas sp. NIBR11 TaxID=3015999 RepID=UPI0022F0B950|nr:hypothetical protein [Brevundimonas sp. NIBR11]WGM29848.1 hypothetical protein KKHFBJBL_00058 [Brevundimonas sp. NIBR11]
MRLQALASIALLAGAGSALAQDTVEDWEIIRQPERKTVFAFVPTTTGLTIGFRCVDGSFGAVIGGLPEAPRGSRIRTLQFIDEDGESHSTTWSVTTDRTVALADYPASLARNLREGGEIGIVIPGGGGEGRNLRHNLTLPASSAAVDETLTACNRPTQDPRDALLPEIEESGLPDGVTWARAPRPSYPQTNYAEGFAVVTCVVQPDGALAQCQIESEHPDDGRFGRNALRATTDARIVSPGETVGQYAPRMIGFRVNYRMAN